MLPTSHNAWSLVTKALKNCLVGESDLGCFTIDFDMETAKHHWGSGHSPDQARSGKKGQTKDSALVPLQEHGIKAAGRELALTLSGDILTKETRKLTFK